MKYVGKKIPNVVDTSSAASAIASVVGRHAQVKSARVASAAARPPSEYDKLTMQAVFDKGREAAGLTHRLMVTVKEMGLLRKRLKENAPLDFADMVRWSLTYWTMLAQQQRLAATKRVVNSSASRSTLPEAPHFQTFCYWHPYFFRCYQNHLASKNIAPDRPPVRERPKPPVSPPRPASSVVKPFVARPRILPAKTTDADLFDDVHLPEWK